MAILKDTVISGSLRATDTIYSTTAQFQILRAPTTSGGTTYGPGTNRNFLKSNGTSAYWTNLAAADIPTISIADKTSGTLAVTRGGTGSTSATGARSNLGLGNAKIFYGICSTAAGTVAKEVECTDFSAEELKSGAAILVTFTQTNSGAVESLTMNVNNTGAKILKKQYNTSVGNLTSAAELITGNTYLFVYNSTYSSNAGAWVLMTTDYNSTYDMAQLYSAAGASRTMETAANGGLGSHLACLQMITKNQTWSAISAVSGSTASNQGTAVAKVASTVDFLLNSPILYVSNNTYVAPGSSANINGYTSFCVNLQYSIGTTATAVALTFQKPVYLVGKVNSDKATFKLDSTQWWTQDLPATNDGKIYIFLGMACSVSNIYLYTHHPIYYHNGTTVKAYNPGIHFQDETLLTNDGNEYVTVTSSNPVYIQNAEARDAENVIIEIEPKQDLHGYDNPWPEGGNKNIMQQTIDSIKAANTNGTWNGNAYTYKDVVFTLLTDSNNNIIGVNANGTASDNADFTIKASDENYLTVGSEYTLSGCPANGSSDTYYQFLCFYSDDGSSSGGGGRDVGTGKQLTVTSGYSRYRVYIRITSGVTCNNLVFHPMLELGSTATSYVPYSNICPISGWTGATVKDEGKNLFDMSQLLQASNWTVNSNGIYSGTMVTLHQLANGNGFPVLPEFKNETQYTLSVSCYNGASSSYASFGFIYDDDTRTNITFSETSLTTKSLVSIAGKTIKTIYASYGSSGNTVLYISQIQVELGSTPTSYEPYKSRIFPISFPSSAGTVYGGTIDLEKKKLVVDRAMVDLGTLTWSATSDRFMAEAITPNPLSKSVWDTDNPMAICSQYKYGVIASNNGVDKAIGFFNGMLYARDTAYSSASGLKAAMSGVQLVYELATPLEYDIPAPQIPLFNGINNLQLDCGKISFNYRTNIYPVSLDKSGNMAVQVPIENNNFHLQNNEYLTTNGNEYVSVSEVSEISIPDAAASNIKNAVISIKPSQDLNGYDAPWPEGGGKNLLEVTATTQTVSGVTYTVNDDGTIHISGTPSANYGSFIIGIVTLPAGNYKANGFDIGSSGHNRMGLVNTSTDASIAQVFGGADTPFSLSEETTIRVYTVILTSDGAVDTIVKPMIRLASYTDASFAPYSNICPIGGWTGAEINITTGKNLFNGELEVGSINSNTGININSSINIRTTGFIRIKPNTIYTLSRNNTTGYVNVRLYNSNKEYLGSGDSTFFTLITGSAKAQPMITGVSSCTFTFTDQVTYFRFQDLKTDLSTRYQLELGSVATSYEPYKSRIFPISFPSTAGTVYGGTIDLETGKLVVDKVKTTLSNKTFGTRQTSTLPAGGFISISNFSPAIDTSIAPISDMLLGTTYENRGADGTIAPNVSTSTLYLFTSHTTEEAQALYSNATIIYSLATPLEYDISIPPITLFNGLNNLWLNCGTMSFDYQTNVYPVSLDKSGNLAVQVSLDNNESNYVLSSNIRPTIYKKYESTSFYGTSNNSATCTFFFMSVRPDEWHKPWRVRFKVHSYCPAYPNNHSVTYCTLSGRLSSSIYSNWNEYFNAAHYYIGVMMLNEAGYNNGLGHAVGIDLRNSTYFNNSAYYRTFEVEYYDCDGCTVSFLDEPVLQANWPNYNTTNYGAINEYNAVDRGLQESGDDDTTNVLRLTADNITISDTFRLGPYSLFGFDRNNKAQGISLYSTDYSSSTVAINTARSYNTAGIDWTRGLYYFSNGTNRNKNANVGNIILYLACTAVDLRYTDNCVPSSTANTLGMVQFKHVYLRGVIKEDGLFYLRPLSVTYNNATYQRAWTQDIPTSVETDGTYPYVYWLIGRPTYNSSYVAALYAVNLEVNNPVYWYHNGAFREYQKWPTYDIQYTSTTPTTRADGVSALQEGDIWFKPVS